MRLLPGLVLGAALATFALMVIGSYVKATGTGLSCPEWPECPLNAVSAAEWIHRILAAAVSLLVLLLTALAARGRKQDPGLFRRALLALGLIAAQVALGAATIFTLNHPVVVAGHQGLALAFFATLLLTTARALRPIPGGS